MKVSRRSNYILFAGASALALSAGAPAAFAQDEDGARTLSTVVVTTQKTEESIQDVPIAVSAFDEESLDKLQLAGGAFNNLPSTIKLVTLCNCIFSFGLFWLLGASFSPYHQFFLE